METKIEERGEQPRLMVKEGDDWVQGCEDCKKPIPGYPHFGMTKGQGFVSPESDKMRAVHLLGISAIQALEKAVCLECYREALKRVYPGRELPV